MNVFNKILTALRGSVRELGESVIDVNATRIYQQEIIDAKNHLQQARHDLTLVMAKEMQAGREIERLGQEITRFEQHAVESLRKNQAALAEEVAERIAALEDERQNQQQAQSEFSSNIVRLKELIKQAENKIREHERQLVMSRTAESVYKATQSISDSMGSGGSRLLSARESLERIKQRHQDEADRLQAAESLEKETSAKALELKLAAAGIGDNADRKRDIMARIQQRYRAANPEPAGGEHGDHGQ